MVKQVSGSYDKGDNFCDLYVFHTPIPFGKGVYSKKKEFAPNRSKFFLIRVDLFSEGRQNRVVSLEKVSIPLYYLGWSKFDERCYKFINERLTWEVAETLCQMSHEAHLSTVLSKRHLTWLSQLSGKKAFWIGKLTYVFKRLDYCTSHVFFNHFQSQ